MSDLRKAAEQALEALETAMCDAAEGGITYDECLSAITAIKEALAQPECSHHFVRDEEAVKHYCCQKCGTVKVDQPEQEPFVVWKARECKQEGLQALSHEQFVRWYAGQAAHGIKGEA